MAKKSAMTFGIIFVIAGVWGFIQSPILGIFAADAVSSIIHIIVGVVLIVVAKKAAVVTALKTVGIVYVVFAVLGFIMGTSMLGIFVVNPGANWLYIVLGVIIAALGFSSKKEVATPSAAPQM